MSAWRVAFVLAAGGLAACTAIAGISGYTIGECKGGVCTPDADTFEPDAGVVPVVDSGKPCPSTAPTMARVGSAGNTFCIDTTEVTIGAYAAFLAAAVPTTTQTSECAWNDTYAPDPSDAGADRPVTGVDRCDALAYCTWAGKYLCGTVENGRKTGPVTTESAQNYRSNQWLLACSAEARLRYPYGSTLEKSACNLADYDAGTLVAVGSATACAGGFEGLHDMLGNAWEWYDGPCIADGALEVDGGDGGPASDNCWFKGGSYGDLAQNIECRTDGTGIRRDFHGNNVGFRCCAD